ncbi:MAG: hypothetical protein ACSNEK_06385 [Parachlamydiaceae bacterium]
MLNANWEESTLGLDENYFPSRLLRFEEGTVREVKRDLEKVVAYYQ